MGTYHKTNLLGLELNVESKNLSLNGDGKQQRKVAEQILQKNYANKKKS